MSTCATGGFVAVVRTTDDDRGLDAAVDTYVQHLAETAFAEAPPPDSDTTEYDGVSMRRVSLSGAGAGTVTVTGAAGAGDGDPVHLLLDRCND